MLSAFLSFYALSNAQRFHPDEAFYMTIARHAAVNGDWLLLAEPLDKPPLTFYTNALALVFLAVETDANVVLQLDPLKGEFAGRIPSVLMSVLIVAVGMQLACSLTDDNQIALITGMLLTLTPLRIVFAPTAFTDLPMLLFGMLSLWMASRRCFIWAGICFATSISAKPQVIFYLPLIIVIFFVQRSSLKHLISSILRFSVPAMVVVLLLWGWDSLRIAQEAESFYQLGQSRYTVTQITPLSDYPQRLLLWWQTNQYLLGNGLITVIGVAIALMTTVYQYRKWQLSQEHSLLWLWVLAFNGIHFMLTLNLFDRNQLVLMPIVIILVSSGLTRIKQGWLTAIVISGMFIFACQATQWQLPIGGDDGRHDGIHELADYLNNKPVATVIYDRWLDWELDYYMGQWTNKRRVYYPTPDALAIGMQELDETGMRYLVAPSDIDITSWLGAVQDIGFIVESDFSNDNFVVYRLQPPE